ncbi:MAG: YidC/Oxa1 family membrane protein insertase [Clostridia bacterium]|nr:YidC/Oxa1 family membrane protein insertase [Clostridia bacterium]
MLLNLLAVSRNVMKDPGVIVGPIAWILGHVINFFYSIIYYIGEIVGTHANSLGIAIILLTIFTRCLMIPLSYKQQKSMYKMQALSPELKKIQAKYKEGMSDPEVQRKMQMETQRLYSENNVSPFSGCLPMLIQLPIFLGLYHVMQNPFKYIDAINQVYTQLSTIVLTAAQTNSTVYDLVISFGQLGSVPIGTSIDVDLFNRIINILGPAEVDQLKTAIASADFDSAYAAKNSIEYFLGLNLTETVGFTLSPKLIIPILSGLTTFLSSWLMTKKNSANADPAMKSQQRIMNITMPLMMAWITTSLPGGIGVYWIVSNLFQLCQQFFLNRHFEKIGADEIIVPKEKKHKKGGNK